MTDTNKAERAARAMGWTCYPAKLTHGSMWYDETQQAQPRPSLADDRFVMAMARWLEHEAGPGYMQAQVCKAGVDRWPDLLADAVIAEGER